MESVNFGSSIKRPGFQLDSISSNLFRMAVLSIAQLYLAVLQQISILVPLLHMKSDIILACCMYSRAVAASYVQILFPPPLFII